MENWSSLEVKKIILKYIRKRKMREKEREIYIIIYTFLSLLFFILHHKIILPLIVPSK